MLIYSRVVDKNSSVAMEVSFLAITLLKIDISWKFWYHSIECIKGYRMILNFMCLTLNHGCCGRKNARFSENWEANRYLSLPGAESDFWKPAACFASSIRQSNPTIVCHIAGA